MCERDKPQLNEKVNKSIKNGNGVKLPRMIRLYGKDS